MVVWAIILICFFASLAAYAGSDEYAKTGNSTKAITEGIFAAMFLAVSIIFLGLKFL